jgi:hypothetical protein
VLAHGLRSALIVIPQNAGWYMRLALAQLRAGETREAVEESLRLAIHWHANAVEWKGFANYPEIVEVAKRVQELLVAGKSKQARGALSELVKGLERKRLKSNSRLIP